MKTKIVRWEVSAEVKRGRKPIGSHAMTSAETSTRHRAKLKASRPPKKNKKTRTEFNSLSDHLSSPDSPVRQFIDAQFPHLRELSEKINLSLRRYDSKPRQEYPKQVLYMLAGTAMDYRIRIYFSDTPHKYGALYIGLRSLNGFISGEDTTRITNPWNTMFRRRGYVGISDKLISSFERFVKKTNPRGRLLAHREEEILCRYCVLFALIDFFRRGSPGAYERLAEVGNIRITSMLKKMNRGVVNDLIKLSTSFYAQNKKLLKNFSIAHIGQALAGSKDVGGADFDLIVDGCLFDIKTTTKPKITTNYLRQLIGYFLLDYQDEFKIRRAAIHLTRQDHSEYFDFKGDLLRTKIPIKTIRESFRQLKFRP